MCLYANKIFEKPKKEVIGWKLLTFNGLTNRYETPIQNMPLKKNQKFLKAKGKKNKINDEYKGGFIHCFRTRKTARINAVCRLDKIIKVKCYNVRAYGMDDDLVCDKIEFLWNEKV